MSDSISPGWHDMLANARTLHEIIAISRDYVERLESHELAMLPPSCMPRQFSTASEISEYAYDLKRCACESRGRGDALLARLALFFSDAAMRITALTGPHRVSYVPAIDWSVGGNKAGN
jgi:hypothetical protein